MTYDFEESLLQSHTLPGYLLLHSFLGPQFLIGNMGRVALPF